jgi:peptidyl-prolyl cis-trans isomerase A (cyclophilin A)
MLGRMTKRSMSFTFVAFAFVVALASPGCKKPASEPPAQITQPAAAAPAPSASADKPSLLKLDGFKEQAPATYRAKFTTSKGDFVLEVQRDWAPQGADRFFNLVKNGYFSDLRFFRVIKGFMVQWGIHGQGEVNTVWRNANLKDDPVKQSNKRGFVSFATAGPNTRTTQVFVNYADNTQLDGMGFAPFGKVVTGMEVIDSLYGGYGEGAPQGRGPSQGRMQSEGNAYLARDFPNLDYIIEAGIMR